jgi:hypothetical protein
MFASFVCLTRNGAVCGNRRCDPDRIRIRIAQHFFVILRVQNRRMTLFSLVEAALREVTTRHNRNVINLAEVANEVRTPVPVANQRDPYIIHTFHL